MDLHLTEPPCPPPVERAYAVSMTIASFKGRRNVEVHLHRAAWGAAEEAAYDWATLIGPPLEGGNDGTAGSRIVLLESFTAAERDTLLEHLKAIYADRLTALVSCPLTFPIPAGLTPLTAITPSKSVGIIDFSRIPSFKLQLPVRGLYNLSQHEPLLAIPDQDLKL